jgi:hypothetical protein
LVLSILLAFKSIIAKFDNKITIIIIELIAKRIPIFHKELNMNIINDKIVHKLERILFVLKWIKFFLQTKKSGKQYLKEEKM